MSDVKLTTVTAFKANSFEHENEKIWINDNP